MTCKYTIIFGELCFQLDGFAYHQGHMNLRAQRREDAETSIKDTEYMRSKLYRSTTACLPATRAVLWSMTRASCLTSVSLMSWDRYTRLCLQGVIATRHIPNMPQSLLNRLKWPQGTRMFCTPQPDCMPACAAHSSWLGCIPLPATDNHLEDRRCWTGQQAGVTSIVTLTKHPHGPPSGICCC